MQKNGIDFNFTAKKIDTLNQKYIKITSNLYNENNHSVYFISSNCDGDQYFLEYDRAQFVLTPFFNCNANHLKVVEIKAKTKYHIKAFFKENGQKQMKLGFAFYPADESLMSKEKLGYNILKKLEKNKFEIWAEEKPIK